MSAKTLDPEKVEHLQLKVDVRALGLTEVLKLISFHLRERVLTVSS